MKLWSYGSSSFHDTIQDIMPARSFDSGQEDASVGDVILMDLDGAEGKDPATKISGWTSQGFKVYVACAPSSLSRAVSAVKYGACQIMLKPLDPEVLRTAVKEEAPAARADQDLSTWRTKYAPEIIGESDLILEALEITAKAATCDCPVLITGENGTGKELLAQALHRASSRTAAPFIAVNCPAIPKELVESELFGHTKGAFTGATMARVGRFAAADNGSLLLDEIGEMDLSIQSKLLRVLQDFQVTRVGESRPQRVDVRVIAATNRDLESMVEEGSFREDLYYRLNVLQIHLPALRSRREDIPILVDHFLKKISQQRGLPAPQLTPQTLETLKAYHWPGNIRQLHNIIERLVILHHGQVVEESQLPRTILQKSPQATTSTGVDTMELPLDGIDLREALQQFEDTMIKQALLQTNGNKNQAAKILGLNRTTLVEKLRKRSSVAC